MLLIILAGAIFSWIALQSTKRRQGGQADAARSQTLAEAIPQIVWIADANGSTAYITKRCYAMTGTGEANSLGTGWIESIHPDDRDPWPSTSLP